MIKFKNINGDVFLAVGSVKHKSALNGEKSLSATITQGDDVLNKIDKGWSLEFDNEPYVVTYFERNDNNNTVEIDAIHKFFWDMTKSVLYNSYSNSHVARFYLDEIFKDTGYTYALNFDPKAFEKENWGMKNKLSLFNDAISSMGAEFEINGTLISIFKNVGSDLSTIVRHGFNLSDMTLENNNANFATYVEGFGAYDDKENQKGPRLHVTYTSPLAKAFGKLHAEPIVDERYTVKDNLLSAVKDKVDSSFAVSVKLSLYDLTAAGYPYKMANVGDWLLAVDEHLDFKQKIRIISVDDEFVEDGTRISYTVTCGDIGVTKKYQDANASLSQKVQSAYDNAQAAKESAIQAVISSTGKNTIYDNIDGEENLPKTANEGDLAFVQTGDGKAMYIYTKMLDGSFEWVKRLDPDTGEQIAAGVEEAISTANKYTDELNEKQASEAAAFQSEANVALSSAAAERADMFKQSTSMATSAATHADSMANSAAAYAKAQAASALSSANSALTTAKSDLTTAIGQETEDRNKAVSAVNSQAQDYATQAKSDAIEAAKTADGQVRKDFKTTTDSLSSTISQNKEDAEGKISTAQSTATQALNGLGTKVSQTDYDKKTSDLSTKVNTVTQTATETKNELANVSKTVDSQSAKINTISNTVDGTKQTISDIQTEQGKQSGSIATLQSRADGFEATVTKVNNLSVGGRNYVQNSSGLNGSSTVRPTLIGTSSGANATVTYPSDGILMTNGDTNTTTEWYYQVASAWTKFSDTPLTPGKQITFSADAMGTVPQAVLRYGFNGGTGGKENYKSFDINNTSWTRVSITVTSNSTNTGLYFRIQGGINNRYDKGWTGGETLKFRYVKIEEGNVATDWTPAPEELESATAKAQLTADKANLDLSTYKTDADGRISKAQSDITATSKEVKTKVSQSDYDTKTGDLTTKYGQVKATADSVTTDVANYKKSNDGRIKADEANIDANSKAIALKVSQVDYDANNKTINGKFAQQTIDSNKILDSVTELQASVNSLGQVNQFINSEFTPDLQNWSVSADTGSTAPYRSFSTYGSNGIGFNTVNAPDSTFASIKQTVPLPNTRLNTDVLSMSWRVNTRQMSQYNHLWLTWQDSKGNNVSDRTMFNWNDTNLNKYNVIKWENVSIPIEAKQVVVSFEAREGTNAYLFQPMLVFEKSIGDYVAGNYNNNNRVTALELDIKGITGLVKDPSKGLSATWNLASNGQTIAVQAQKDATMAITTAKGLQTTIDDNKNDLQAQITATAKQVTTEITDRTNGDKSVRTDMAKLIDQRVSSVTTGYETAISQSATAITLGISKPNQFLNTEFNPDLEGWETNTSGNIRAPYRSYWQSDIQGTVVGWNTLNGSASSYSRLRQDVRLPSTPGAGHKISMSWYSYTSQTDFYNNLWVTFYDKDNKSVGNKNYKWATTDGTNPSKQNSWTVQNKWEGIEVPDTAVMVNVSFEAREGTSAYLGHPMLVFGPTIGPYMPGSYSGMNSSTVLQLFKDNWGIGLADNIGKITSGIIGDKNSLNLINNNIVLQGKTTVTADFYAKGGNFKNLNASNFTTGTINAAKINVINLDVSSLSGNITNFIKSYWNNAYSNVTIDGNGMSITAGKKRTDFKNGAINIQTQRGENLGFLGTTHLTKDDTVDFLTLALNGYHTTNPGDDHYDPSSKDFYGGDGFSFDVSGSNGQYKPIMRWNSKYAADIIGTHPGWQMLDHVFFEKGIFAHNAADNFKVSWTSWSDWGNYKTISLTNQNGSAGIAMNGDNLVLFGQNKRTDASKGWKV